MRWVRLFLATLCALAWAGPAAVCRATPAEAAAPAVPSIIPEADALHLNAEQRRKIRFTMDFDRVNLIEVAKYYAQWTSQPVTVADELAHVVVTFVRGQEVSYDEMVQGFTLAFQLAGAKLTFKDGAVRIGPSAGGVAETPPELPPRSRPEPNPVHPDLHHVTIREALVKVAAWTGWNFIVPAGITGLDSQPVTLVSTTALPPDGVLAAFAESLRPAHLNLVARGAYVLVESDAWCAASGHCR